jgi:hypothetical protein
MRYILLLLIGVAAGYYLGWKDHETHDEHIVSRLQARAGAAARDKVKNDADSALRSVEDPQTSGAPR